MTGFYDSTNYRIFPTFHVSLLKPTHSTDNKAKFSPEPLLPLKIEGSTAYLGCSLLDAMWQRDPRGYKLKEQSWVNSTDILDPTLIDKFHYAHLDKPSPRPWSKTRHRIVCLLCLIKAPLIDRALQVSYRFCFLRNLHNFSFISVFLCHQIKKFQDVWNRWERVHNPNKTPTFSPELEQMVNPICISLGFKPRICLFL